MILELLGQEFVQEYFPNEEYKPEILVGKTLFTTKIRILPSMNFFRIYVSKGNSYRL